MPAAVLPKFLPPRPRHLLVRPRLHALLDAAEPARGLWLTGPAGAGKSTLAASWGAASGRPLAWWRVDATDLDLASALASLAALLGTLTRRKLPPALRRAPPAEGGPASGAGVVGPALQAHLRQFFRGFHALAGPLVLVVDDAHAAASPAMDALLLAALDETPPGSALLITSRQPPAGVLLEALARAELWALEGAALDFTLAETQALLGPRLGEAAAQRLHRRTGGWAAGLTLLAAQPAAPEAGRAPTAGQDLAGGAAADSADTAGTARATPAGQTRQARPTVVADATTPDHPDQNEPAPDQAAEQRLADFFTQRVLGVLDADQQQLLGAVSLLPEVDDSQLPALGLGPGAADALDALSDRLGFVQRLRPGRRCWRLHDLLAESVQARWPQLGTDAWRQATLQAAAGLLGGQGRLQAAVALLRRAGAGAQAVALWRQGAPRLLRQGRALELQRAFALLPPALAEADAAVLTQRGLAAWQAQDADTGHWFDRAWAALDAAPAQAAAPADPADRLRCAAAALNGQFSGWRSYVGREVWLQRFLDAWAQRGALSDADEGLRADKAAVLVFLAHRMAPWPVAEQQALAERVMATLGLGPAPDGPDPNAAVSVASSLLDWCNYLGDRALLARLVDISLPWLAHPGLAGATQASWWITYGWVSVRLGLGRGDVPEGEAAVAHGVALADACGAPDTCFYGLSNLAAAAMARNALPLAEQRLQQLQAAAAQRSGAPAQPTQQATLHVLAARWLTLRGDAATALVRVQRALALAQASEFPASETWIYHLAHVQVLTALGQEDQAVALAGQQAAAYDGLRADYLHALAHLAHCARAWRQGQPAAPAHVAGAVQLAARHGWSALGNHLHGLVARLAAAALAQGEAVDFVRQMVRQRQLRAPEPDLPDWPWPLRIQALGGFAVASGGQPLDFGARPQKKPLDLLRLLVAQGPAPLATATALDALWPASDGDKAKGALDMAVLRLRKLLGQDEALRVEDGHLALNRGLVWVDAWAWAAGQAVPYGGPLFGSAPPELAWAARREALHLQYLRRSHAQAQAQMAAGAWAEALALYEAALQHDSLDEALHRGAIRCLLALGEPAAAQRAFERCAQRLMAGLGVAPSAATLALLSGHAP